MSQSLAITFYNIFSELFCPESHPFAAPPKDVWVGKPHVSGLKCCFSETGEGCEGSMSAACQGIHLDYDPPNTCKDHPSAVRKPGEFY